jgi:hypothetical protein
MIIEMEKVDEVTGDISNLMIKSRTSAKVVLDSTDLSEIFDESIDEHTENLERALRTDTKSYFESVHSLQSNFIIYSSRFVVVYIYLIRRN